MRSTNLIVVIVLLSSCAGSPNAGPTTNRSAAPQQSPKLLVEPVLPGDGAPGESGAGGTSAERGSGGRRSPGQGDAPDGGDRNSQGSAPAPGAPDHDRQAESYGPPIDPCSVLTEGEVEALAVGQVRAPDGPKEPAALGVRRMQDCVFRSEVRQRPYIAVTVGVTSSSGRDGFEEYRDRRAHAERLPPVPGWEKKRSGTK